MVKTKIKKEKDVRAEPPEFISRREFARRAGCNEKQVRRGIASGRLQVNAQCLLNAAQIEWDWRREYRVKEEIEQSALNAAIERKEFFTGQLRQLEYERKSGAVIEVSVAEALFFNAAREQRNSWLSWPSRVAPLIAADLSIEPERLLDLLNQHVHKQITDLGEPEAEFQA